MPPLSTYNFIFMAERESFVLTRDVNIVTIPDGTPSTLSKGEEVTIHQSLGNNYTVVTERGHMVRIAGVDADALGKEHHELHTLVLETSAEAVEKNCWEVMKTVYDPEIPVNIVDLGLVYYCLVKALDDENEKCCACNYDLNSAGMWNGACDTR